ncbi:DUF2933 domain-containing protein [Caenimonas sedimenti]|uniref:DUF2933 domain-containing protein n=1 Tax=Caenimonas sedimenti TaxID=2596921 RepID=A0A562ZPG6_9BURK|nr:DUF2933 domain-containing protein [Caenimonas sedimenti]TWO70054.1 DUF2933 domain-containing protein [Caenimonas sedimenti]
MTPDPAAPSPGSTQRAGIGVFLRSHYALGYLVLGALATYLYFSEHRAHFLGALPFLLILACPLMHLFMHRGHGGHGGRGSHGARPPADYGGRP